MLFTSCMMGGFNNQYKYKAIIYLFLSFISYSSVVDMYNYLNKIPGERVGMNESVSTSSYSDLNMWKKTKEEV